MRIRKDKLVDHLLELGQTSSLVNQAHCCPFEECIGNATSAFAEDSDVRSIITEAAVLDWLHMLGILLMRLFSSDELHIDLTGFPQT